MLPGSPLPVGALYLEYRDESEEVEKPPPELVPEVVSGVETVVGSESVGDEVRVVDVGREPDTARVVYEAGAADGGEDTMVETVLLTSVGMVVEPAEVEDAVVMNMDVEVTVTAVPPGGTGGVGGVGGAPGVTTLTARGGPIKGSPDG